MTAPRNAPARAASARDFIAAQLYPPVAAILLAARAPLLEYIRDGWILVELAYALALYLFAFRYPFEAPFFFETANWSLGLLAAGTTLLLISRAPPPDAAQPAITSAARRVYTAGLMLAAAALRIVEYVVLLALVLFSRRLINATSGALFAGSVGLIAGCIVLAALTLALSPAYAPRFARLIFLAWLTAALYSYTATGLLAAFFFVWRLPLLPLFACYTMGMTGTIGWNGGLALLINAGYVVGLVMLATFLRARRDAAKHAGEQPEPPAGVPDQAAAHRDAVPLAQRENGQELPAQQHPPRNERATPPGAPPASRAAPRAPGHASVQSTTTRRKRSSSRGRIQR